MSAPKHTPGPWSVNRGGPWICTVGNNVGDPAVFGPRPEAGPFQFGDKAADAQLIAAAPDMLDALQQVAGRYHVLDHADQAVFNAVRAAIVKATGTPIDAGRLVPKHGSGP